MRDLRILLLVLPLCFLGAGSAHQACGPICFGMKGAELQKASAQLRAGAKGGITAATLRQSLVNDGMKRAARLADRDDAVRLEMRYAPGRPLDEITFNRTNFTWPRNTIPR
jgi:hypothetical protein